MPVFHKWLQSTIHNGFFIFRILAKSDQFLIEIKYGIWINRLFFHINCGIIGIYSKPRCTSCKSGIFLTSPLHGGTGIVAAAAGNSFQSCFRGKSGVKCNFIFIQS